MKAILGYGGKIGVLITMIAVGCATRPVIQKTTAWIWETNSNTDQDREVTSSGLILNGPLKAEGNVPAFMLESELHIIPQPMKPNGLTYADTAQNEIAITIDDGPSEANNGYILKVVSTA